MTRYRYMLEVLTADAETSHRFSLEPDFEPARECTWLDAVVRDRLAPETCVGSATIEPAWNPDAGPPYMTGFRVSFGDGPESVSDLFAIDYFRPHADEAAAALVKRGDLGAGEEVRFLVSAHTVHEPAAPASSPGFTAEEVAAPLPLREGSPDALLAASACRGVEGDGDRAVVIENRVLEEVDELTRAVRGTETGGILVGELVLDRTSGKAALHVTAQIHAEEARSDTCSLTFSPDDWTRVQRVLDLRNRGELMIGWWHSHPVSTWCRDCPVENQKACHLAKDFLSSHDRALHRTVFPRAYSIALVVNDVGFSDPVHSLFGWRRGRLEVRGFRIHDRTTRDAPASR